MVVIQIFHTINIILADTSRFSFIGSIPEVMLRNVPAASEVMRTYHSLPASGLRPITCIVRKILVEVDRPKKGGKKIDAKSGLSKPTQTPKKKVNRVACKLKSPTPSDQKIFVLQHSIKHSVSRRSSPQT